MLYEAKAGEFCRRIFSDVANSLKNLSETDISLYSVLFVRALDPFRDSEIQRLKILYFS